MSSDLHTVFIVPRLNTASVVAGACCPVPAEAVILPEIDAVPGVLDASADWASATIRVRHAAHVRPESLAQVLAELDYPAESWNTAPLRGVEEQ